MEEVGKLDGHGVEVENEIEEVDRQPWLVEDNSGPGVLVKTSHWL